MSFKPLANQSYYLIAKHSAKALGFANTNLGTGLIQMKFDPDNKQQQFRFEFGNNFHFILMAPYRERFLAIHNSSKDDGAHPIFWQWERDKANLQFRFIPAGDGYYRIMNLNSGKYLDVYGLSTADNAEVVQHRLTTTDNQLFKPVAVIDQPADDNPTSFIEINEMAHTAALGLIGALPEVGGGLKVIVEHFWSKEDKLANLWEQMKVYVDARIRELIKEAQLKQLKEMLEGQLKSLAEINTNSGFKGNNIEAVILNIVTKEPHFLKQSKEVLPYLVGLGTLMIALRHMMVTKYKDLYGVEPTDAVKANNLRKLKASIKEYSGEVEKSRKAVMDFRMAHVKDRRDYTIEGRGTFPRDTHVSEAVDTYDGWKMEWKFTSNRIGDENYKQLAGNAAEQRKNQVKTQYGTELDEFLLPAKLWKYFDPEHEAYKETVNSKTTGLFGGPYKTTEFKGKENGVISKIKIYAEAGVLCGLEVFYDGSETSDGLKGKAGNSVETLTVGTGEYINHVIGYFNRHVDGLWFSTQKASTAGGGSMGNTYFTADLSDGFNPKLVNISGYHSAQQIEQLNFHWQYKDFPLSKYIPKA
ncbi:RICIN domain-containing protein [Pedobacter roseus]|uniref:RICIN domain-containing protein n=1 Tax=Pedobacter roseus TaxID=336820 RepID=A0A7G9QGB2_9SPHI|nr:RICIN domain-containing protein [Pedobacter roseus]QNN42387.1 RICIN domain-containing protein [Pedobacter roseus]